MNAIPITPTVSRTPQLLRLLADMIDRDEAPDFVLLVAEDSISSEDGEDSSIFSTAYRASDAVRLIGRLEILKMEIFASHWDTE